MARPLQLAGLLISVFQAYLSPNTLYTNEQGSKLVEIGDDQTEDA